MITREEWIAELERIYKGNTDGAFSTGDIQKSLAVSEATARRRIKDAINDGIIQYAGTRMEPTMSQVMKPIPVYRVVSA